MTNSRGLEGCRRAQLVEHAPSGLQRPCPHLQARFIEDSLLSAPEEWHYCSKAQGVRLSEQHKLQVTKSPLGNRELRRRQMCQSRWPQKAY